MFGLNVDQLCSFKLFAVFNEKKLPKKSIVIVCICGSIICINIIYLDVRSNEMNSSQVNNNEFMQPKNSFL